MNTDVRLGSLLFTVGGNGMKADSTNMEIGLEFPQKSKNRFIIQSCSSIFIIAIFALISK